MLKNRITFCLIVCLCINFLFQSCNGNKSNEFLHDEDGKPDCNCKYDVGCFWLTQQCKKPEVGCEPTYNCGVLGTAECKGVCRYI